MIYGILGAMVGLVTYGDSVVNQSLSDYQKSGPGVLLRERDQMDEQAREKLAAAI